MCACYAIIIFAFLFCCTSLRFKNANFAEKLTNHILREELLKFEILHLVDLRPRVYYTPPPPTHSFSHWLLQ